MEMKAECERCAHPLPVDSTDAFVCSFECTWCRACAEGDLAGRCPNCDGELVRRPTRAVADATA